ncbi:MAG: hypothetical protein JJ901_15390 [Erythrobacter sp.]|uniref:helix-turn-helix domain-containing protein n=1 Tax=Erythrobacter sp. TaxID=1042 RepID=UPI001B1F50B2|nr:helix-turn-helix domain-containing protein [Erythrobacter sp.]MBO6769675.1 hypothetical protein [Erythrobacter sp.]
MPNQDDSLLDEMRDIKRLLILQLLESGTPQGRIATMLGVSAATMSRMLPKGLTKSIRGGDQK